MIRVSAYPTVEWLHARAADRPAAPHRMRAPGPRTACSDARTDSGDPRAALSRPCVARTSAPTRRSFIESVVRRLRAFAARGVLVRTDQWVATPEGEQPVDIVVRRGNRCIGVMVDCRYEHDTETLDALRLVYGHFDTLYRVNRTASATPVNDLVMSIVGEKSAWFTCVGWTGARTDRSSDIRRMRLSRANEWVRAFERALAPGGCTDGLRRKRASAGHEKRD